MKLLSIKELCSLFEVAPLTVRNALKKLEEEGYILITKGRPAQVIWDFNKRHAKDTKEFFSDYIRDRFEAIVDIYRTTLLIYPTIYLQGFWLQSDDELKQLQTILNDISKAKIYLLTEFFNKLLYPLGNPFCTYFILDVSIFSQFFFYWNSDERSIQIVRYKLSKLISSCQTNNSQEVLKIFRWFQKRAYQLIGVFTKNYFPQPDVKQIPFQWISYKGRTRYNFFIAENIIRKIRDNVYPPFSPLPKVCDLAQEYSVSKNTVRQAIKLLNHMGLVETLNGIGSQVLPLQEQLPHQCSDEPAFKKSIIQFLQALQFMVLIIEKVIQYSFPLLDAKTSQQILDYLTTHLESGQYFQRISFLKFFIRSSHLSTLNEIYEQLKGYLLWGYSSLFYIPVQSAPPIRSQIILQMLESFKCRDGQSFASHTRELYQHFFLIDREKAIKSGIPEAEKIALPSFNDPV